MPAWARWWTVVPAQARPTAALTVRWQLLDGAAALDNVRVRAGRMPGVWADAATVRPAADGTLAVELQLPVEVWAAPAVLEFTVTLTDRGRPGPTYTLTAAEPFFWNGSDVAIDVELHGHVHEDGTVEPRVADVLVHF
jgi:hypothetical protein